MPWIESHTVLIRHRKLIQLAKDLRLKPVHALGHLHALWHVALEQQEDGDLSSWTDEFIADSAQFLSDAPQFVSLLQKNEWLNGKVLHDWLDYAGMYLIKKYSTSNRQRLAEIWTKHSRTYGESSVVNEKRTGSETKVTLPNQTLPNLTKPTKDKYEKMFEDFWGIYPARNGKKLGKGETKYRFLLLNEGEVTLVLRAARNYAESEIVKSGYGIKDPIRFFSLQRDESGNKTIPFWREWLNPEKKEQENPLNLNKKQLANMEALSDFARRKGAAGPEDIRTGNGDAILGLPSN